MLQYKEHVKKCNEKILQVGYIIIEWLDPSIGTSWGCEI